MFYSFSFVNWYGIVFFVLIFLVSCWDKQTTDSRILLIIIGIIVSRAALSHIMRCLPLFFFAFSHWHSSWHVDGETQSIQPFAHSAYRFSYPANSLLGKLDYLLPRWPHKRIKTIGKNSIRDAFYDSNFSAFSKPSFWCNLYFSSFYFREDFGGNKWTPSQTHFSADIVKRVQLLGVIYTLGISLASQIRDLNARKKISFIILI